MITNYLKNNLTAAFNTNFLTSYFVTFMCIASATSIIFYPLLTICQLNVGGMTCTKRLLHLHYYCFFSYRHKILFFSVVHISQYPFSLELYPSLLVNITECQILSKKLGCSVLNV